MGVISSINAHVASSALMPISANALTELVGISKNPHSERLTARPEVIFPVTAGLATTHQLSATASRIGLKSDVEREILAAPLPRELTHGATLRDKEYARELPRGAHLRSLDTGPCSSQACNDFRSASSTVVCIAEESLRSVARDCAKLANKMRLIVVPRLRRQVGKIHVRTRAAQCLSHTQNRAILLG